jgi:predicted RNA-binding protein with PIN domain
MLSSPRHFLIDGYNLMHALGVQPPRLAEAGLQAARQRLLTYLAEQLGERSADATVIFDAVRAPARLDSESQHRGIQVRFARGVEADDVIEELIRRSAVPQQLAVVSNDLRLVRAAERRGCAALRCSEFLDWLQEQQSLRRESRANDAAQELSSETDKDHWLAEFGHLDDDPSLGTPPPFADTDET